MTTRFVATKQTAMRRGTDLLSGQPIHGYEIHHGNVTLQPGRPAWFHLDGAEDEGVADESAGVYGTSLHGVLECAGVRSGLLDRVARRRGTSYIHSDLDVAAARAAQTDRVADACVRHLDLAALWAIAGEAAGLEETVPR